LLKLPAEKRGRRRETSLTVLKGKKLERGCEQIKGKGRKKGGLKERD